MVKKARTKQTIWKSELSGEITSMPWNKFACDGSSNMATIAMTSPNAATRVQNPVAAAVPAAPDPINENDAITSGQCGATKRNEWHNAIAVAWNAADYETRIRFLEDRVASLTPKRFVQFAEWFDEYRLMRNPDGTEAPDGDGV